jgi:N-acetylmuramoyl-L-alanine amidase
VSFSPLAKRVTGVRDPALGSLRAPWGFLVHTTGSGVTALAKKQGKTPLEVAIEIYIASQNGSNGYMWGGATYVCDYDGELYQLAPDNVKTAHCGGRSEKYPQGTRAFYIDGTWVTKLPVAVVDLWRWQWPTRRHPYSLFPTTDPNTAYVGIECIPIADGFGGSPMAPGLRFTTKQHNAVAELGKDLARRHGWPEDWSKTGRLVGHEDVDILNRSDKRGGWDPGWLRKAPYFDFTYVRGQL